MDIRGMMMGLAFLVLATSLAGTACRRRSPGCPGDWAWLPDPCH
jgi:hypothetical protein